MALVTAIKTKWTATPVSTSRSVPKPRPGARKKEHQSHGDSAPTKAASGRVSAPKHRPGIEDHVTAPTAAPDETPNR